jgi:hypothetical protein
MWIAKAIPLEKKFFLVDWGKRVSGESARVTLAKDLQAIPTEPRAAD